MIANELLLAGRHCRELSRQSSLSLIARAHAHERFFSHVARTRVCARVREQWQLSRQFATVVLGGTDARRRPPSQSLLQL